MQALNRRRITFVIALFFIAFSLILLRLGFVTFYQANTINLKAYELWKRDIPVEAKRGNIYDRNGTIIVGNELSYTVASINKEVKDKNKTATILAEILKTDKEKILKHIEKNNSIEIIKPEGRKIDKDTASKIASLNLDGIYITYDNKRYYPFGNTLAVTLGFCGIDNTGLSGIEYQYDEFLKGQKGKISIYTDAKGNLMKNESNEYSRQTPGLDLTLTIDINIQKIMENVIERTVDAYTPKQVMGLIVSVKTGEVLALYSYPGFDPNNYQEYDSNIYNRNLPLFYQFEPGSTFKILTYAMAYQNNLFDLNERIFCSGSSTIGGVKIKCWKHGGHGFLTMLEGIENSCNVCFMELARRLGVDEFYRYLKLFRMDEKTGIDINQEGKGIIVKKEACGPVELATQGFGQASAYTPIELAMAAISTVNGGDLLKPYIVKNIKEISGDVLFQNKRTVRNKTVSEKTSDIMRYALESVVALGTGRNAFIEGYRVGGKTGTAQVISANGGYESGHYILSFLGMAPMNDPEILCYVAVDKPLNCTQYGGVIVAPIVGEILEQALSYLGIKRDYENQIEKNLRWLIDSPSYSVIDYVGMTKTDIKENPLFKYLYYGDGNKVIFQSPDKNERIKEGDTILLYMGN